MSEGWSVFGLGCVGVASSACLASLGHDVTGVDIKATKVDQINAGHSPVIEDRIQDLVRDMHAAGRLKPGTDDLRKWPFVALAERLLGRGLPLRIYHRMFD